MSQPSMNEGLREARSSLPEVQENQLHHQLVEQRLGRVEHHLANLVDVVSEIVGEHFGGER